MSIFVGINFNLLFFFETPTIGTRPECVKWSRINVDLWGPAMIQNNGQTHKIHVMIMIDPVTGWFEVARLRNGPTALEAQRLL